MKRSSATPLRASDMLSFRICQCGSNASMQMPQQFAKVLWVRGHVPQVCFERVIVNYLFHWWWVGVLTIGAHDHCLRRPPTFDPLCPQSAFFRTQPRPFPKLVSRNWVISGHAQNVLLFRKTTVVVTLSWRFLADLLGIFWGDLMGTL